MTGRIKVDYTTGEVAKMFGVSPKCVRDWIRRGELRAYRKGNRWSVSLSALRDNMDRWESLSIKQQIFEHNIKRS